MPKAWRNYFNSFVSIGVLFLLSIGCRSLHAGAANDEAPISKKTERPGKKDLQASPAETIELGQRSESVKAPGVGISSEALKGGSLEGIGAVRVRASSFQVERGEAAIFSLEGPEDFLAQVAGQYVFQDSHGRDLYRGAFKVGALTPDAEGRRIISIPTFNALTVKHELKVVLVGLDDQRIERSAEVVVTQYSGWDGWLGLLHAPYKESRWQEVKSLGVVGGMAYRLNAKRIDLLRSAGVPFYVENLAYGLFSNYHAKKGLWNETISACLQDRGSHEALARKPSFSSVAFASAFADELKRHARAYKADHPLFYSVASEPSVTRLAAAYDFDFSTSGLNEFRRWLEREVYGTLSALNAAWGTTFKQWDAVVPMTTFDTQLRLQDNVMNFAPWLDFRVFQDVQFARVLKEGGALLRVEDAEARIGITGAMGAFAFGGWDWSLLSNSLDVVEAYDISQARALWRDLAPGKPALISVNLRRNPLALRDAKRSIWNSVLEGGPRGALIWDVAKASEGKGAERVLLDEGGRPTPAGLDLKSTFVPLSGSLGKLLANARRSPAVVGLLYSPNSIRMNWLLEANALHGNKWLENWGADTTRERKESSQLKLRESWSKLLADLGVSWRFVSSVEIEKGVLDGDTALRVIVLPGASAMSDLEVERLTRFVKAGGTLVADAGCARFDQHGRLRKIPALDALFGVNTSKNPFLPQAVNPLVRIHEIKKGGPSMFLGEGMSSDDFMALPPVFSDASTWGTPPPTLRCEYRKSPVLVQANNGKGKTVYLNLNLDEYFRWRLTTDSRRVAATLKVLRSLAFNSVLAKGVVDLSTSKLPWGTEVIYLQQPDGTLVLALRRNTQNRLHELGVAGDDNRAFQRAEPFELVVRNKYWATDLLNGKPQFQIQEHRIKGRLDPVEPSLWALSKAKAGPISFNAAVPVTSSDHYAINILAPKKGAANVGYYEMRVFDPTGKERYSYGGSWQVSSEKFSLDLPLALNDPQGVWIVVVRELLSGVSKQLEVNVKRSD